MVTTSINKPPVPRPTIPGCTMLAQAAFVNAPTIHTQVISVPPIDDARAASRLTRREVMPTSSGKKKAAPTMAIA